MFQLKSDKKEEVIGEETTFSGFVLQACRYALDNMDESNISNK